MEFYLRHGWWLLRLTPIELFCLLQDLRALPQVRADVVADARNRLAARLLPVPASELAARLLEGSYTSAWAACGSVVASRCQPQAKRPT
jgi:hypothetical protein